jgi:hypothetical protein
MPMVKYVVISKIMTIKFTLRLTIDTYVFDFSDQLLIEPKTRICPVPLCLHLRYRGRPHLIQRHTSAKKN